MTGGVTDPGQVHTRAAFGAALGKRLGRSVRALETDLNNQHAADQGALAAGRLGHPVGVTAGKTTINEVFNGTRLPTPELLDSLLRLVRASDEEHQRWRAALRRAKQSPTPSPQVLVSAADPRLLGVHGAIHLDGAEGFLPTYVPRDTDTTARGVRALISAAADCGGFVLLVGDSSVGKTRCAYEAITTLLPDWRLLHPAAGSDQLTRLATNPLPQTVVWLDELQRYLNGRDGLTADTLRALLSAPGPIVLVATLWPGRYTTYTTPPQDGHNHDPYRWEREVLNLAEVTRLDRVWTEPELDRAHQAAADDPRIKYAVNTHSRFSLPQILAAAPQLAQRWDHADPYAAAVLAAAIDATRLGYQSPLPADLLRTAAVGYCDTHTQATAPPHWFNNALAYATETLHGAASALEPAAADMGVTLGYTVADYLQHYATPQRHRQPIPHHTWDALLTHTHNPTDATRLAQAATNRLLYTYALPLLHQSANTGNPTATHQLADLLAKRGEVDPAITILRTRAEAGDTLAASRLADLLAKQGDVDTLQARAKAGDPMAAYRLADLLAKRGEVDPAITILRTHADAGDTLAAYQLAELLAERGEVDPAITILRTHADAGDPTAAHQLAALLAKRGDGDALLARAKAGDTTAAYRLAELLAKGGEVDAAITILRTHADAGDTLAACRLAELLAKRGEVDAAITILRTHADAGSFWAAHQLADLLAKQGDVDTLQARAEAGDTMAVNRLAELLAKRGEVDAAITILRTHADAGSFWAAHQLAELLAERGEVDAAITILRTHADAGDTMAACLLAALLLAHQGDAEVLLLNEVRVGNSEHAATALLSLLESSENPADRKRAQHIRRYGLTPPTP
jgi:predicted negative regulator of RcsB-dependent stress response